MLAAYGTSSQWATVIYFLGTFAFGVALFIFKFVIFKDHDIPFGFNRNAPLYAYSLAIFLITVVYLLAQSVAVLTGGQFYTNSLVPELLKHIATLGSLPTFIPGGNVGAVLQELALQLGDVGPAEELFKVFVIDGILIILIAKLNLKRYNIGLTFVVMTLANALWTLLHGIVAYHAAGDFWTAFVAGEIILSPTWFFGNPLPAIITHALWNTMGIYNQLTVFNMFIVAGVFGPLTILLYIKRR
jgi:hypothetical protein